MQVEELCSRRDCSAVADVIFRTPKGPYVAACADHAQEATGHPALEGGFEVIVPEGRTLPEDLHLRCKCCGEHLE